MSKQEKKGEEFANNISKQGASIIDLAEKIRRPRQADAVDHSGDPLDWLRASVPGEPGQDYPVLSAIQETSFSCADRVTGGYYADPEQRCQAYHVCLQDSELNLYPVSFLCPNGTVFNQAVFVCDWWFNVDCSASQRLYAGVEGAFAGLSGDNPGSSSCPASPSPAASCQGAAPSNCWSPGQTDTDCPNNGLCCFDGCADRCLDAPSQGSEAAPAQTVPVEKPSEPKGYSYPVPDEPLLLPKPRPPPPGLPTLYGAPPI